MSLADILRLIYSIHFLNCGNRAEVLMKAIKEFISDFHTTDLSSGTSRSSIGISFIDQLKPNLNFLTKCRPFIKSEACIIGTASDIYK